MTSLISYGIQGQSSQIAAFNKYINFSNECTHGMLIVHRLLENFNQEVNKFVNLESQQVNFYSNKDLPKNIFEDPDHWFYEQTPYEWYQVSISQELDSKWNLPLKEVANQMRQTITAINQVRFEADQFISDNDLNERSNQEKIYAILENGVTLFEQFYLNQKRLRKLIQEFSATNQIASSKFETVHDQAYVMLESLRYKSDNNWDSGIEVMERANLNMNLKGDQKTKLSMFLKGAREFIETAEVSPEYKQYGKYYFYHNSKLLNYVNRYGNGYVNAYNENIDIDNQLKLLEIPHFYQVIYPTRWLEDVPLASKDPVILALPDKLKDRTITVSDRSIQVDSDIVELEIFDHKMIDGDIVSVNFNGDWILEEHALKGKPFPLKVKLNKTGKNFLLLHAVNLGRKPPNTMALRYVFQGKTETVVLSSDLDESEVIELVIVE